MIHLKFTNYLLHWLWLVLINDVCLCVIIITVDTLGLGSVYEQICN